MAISVYTGNLNVLGATGNLTRWAPRLTVRPEVEATGVWGIISSKPRTIAVDPVTGEFSVSLYPSTELTGADGRAGVKYILELALFDTTFDDSPPMVRHDLWVFTAISGGGNIHEMGSAAPNALIMGPPWPPKPRPGTYFDVVDGDLSYYGIEVV